MRRYAENAPCPKCGRHGVTTRYTHETYTGQEVLERQCMRCAYTWHEAPLDATQGDTDGER